MDQLVEKCFIGKWRSFKIFKNSGRVHFNNSHNFIQLVFNPDRVLTIKSYSEGLTKNIAETDRWTIVFDNKRHYIDSKTGKFRYEVITVNHTVMVLLDVASSDKIFFTKDEHWQNFLQSNKHELL
ncbi:MAG: hypothetical protein JWQ40_866 [Segetibacter sp.]|jgi:hypothetical protein|nr:hypothetical protein [Segetibacter sp.]